MMMNFSHKRETCIQTNSFNMNALFITLGAFLSVMALFVGIENILNSRIFHTDEKQINRFMKSQDYSYISNQNAIVLNKPESVFEMAVYQMCSEKLIPSERKECVDYTLSELRERGVDDKINSFAKEFKQKSGLDPMMLAPFISKGEINILFGSASE